MVSCGPHLLFKAPRIWSVLIPVLVALLLGLTLFVSGVCDAIGGNAVTVAITDFLFSHLTDHCDQPLGTLVTWINQFLLAMRQELR